MTVAAVGSFLLVVNTGMEARKAQGIHYDFNSPGTENAVSTYFNDFEIGKQVIKSKSDHFMASFFDGPAAAESPKEQVETARREAPPEEDSAPYSHQKKFWEDDYSGNGGDAGNGFRQSLDGGEAAAAGSSMSAGLSGVAGNGGPAKNPVASFDPASVHAGKRPTHASHGIFGGAATSDERSVAPKLYAALSGNSAPQNTVQDSGQPWTGGALSGDGDRKSGKGGVLSGMPGQNAGASLGGASEGMKSASQSDYNSKMSGGAAAAASSGGSAPAVSAPKKASAGGEAGGSPAITADKAAKAASDEKTGTDAGTGKSGTVTPPAEDNTPDLLKTVVYEKLNGMDTKYVSQQEAAGAPDEKLLKAGGIAVPPVTKSLAASAPDPADLNSLSDKRKTELKKELYVFMANVENQYGKMTDLYRTSCDLTPDVCKAGGVSGSYLTMTTAKRATVVFSLKYVNSKWLLYTMDFKMPK